MSAHTSDTPQPDAPSDALLPTLVRLPLGYSEGLYAGRRWSLTLKRAADGRRWWLWAEALGASDRVSANLYVLADGRERLKPCEMPADRVHAFVTGYRLPDQDPALRQPVEPPWAEDIPTA